MRKNKLLFVLIAFIIFPSITNALEESSWSLVDKGIEVMEKDKVGDFEITLQTNVMNLNNLKKVENGKYITYRYNINTVMKNYPTEKLICEEQLVDKKFANEESAIEYYNNIEVDEEKIKGDYIITSSITKETIKNDSKICNGKSCEKEIKKVKEELKEDEKLTTEVVAKTETKKVYYEKNGKIVLFDTEEKARLYSIHHIPFLKDWRFDGNKVETTVVKESKSYEKIVGKNIYDTLEEATIAKTDFEEKYANANIGIKQITNFNELICNTEIETTEYENKAEADQRTNYLKWFGNNAKTIEKTKIIESDYDEVFDTELAVQNKIDDYKNTGYTIINQSIDKIENKKYGFIDNITRYKSNNDINVENCESQRSNNNCRNERKYIFDNNTDYILLLNGNSITVWTKVALTEEEQNIFKISYNNQRNNVIVPINNNTKINFLSGFETFRYQEKNKDYSYNYRLENNKIVLTVCNSKVDNVLYGNLKNEINYQYKLTLKLSKEVKYYQVEITKCTPGFDYKIEGSGDVDVTKYMVASDLSRINLTLNYEIYKNIYTYSLSYNICTPEQVELAEVSWNIEKMLSGLGGDEEITEEVILPPKTGLEKTNYSFIILALILSFYMKLKLKNN